MLHHQEGRKGMEGEPGPESNPCGLRFLSSFCLMQGRRRRRSFWPFLRPTSQNSSEELGEANRGREEKGREGRRRERGGNKSDRAAPAGEGAEADRAAQGLLLEGGRKMTWLSLRTNEGGRRGASR